MRSYLQIYSFSIYIYTSIFVYTYATRDISRKVQIETSQMMITLHHSATRVAVSHSATHRNTPQQTATVLQCLTLQRVASQFMEPTYMNRCPPMSHCFRILWIYWKFVETKDFRHPAAETHMCVHTAWPSAMGCLIFHVSFCYTAQHSATYVYNVSICMYIFISV